ncbi:MAG: flagellar basal body P-ring formation protein FlgA [Bdellovibrio sp.]|nr:flagellar basal body P-ring formation protein FlgA [Bdellovibrio sp.]
MLIVNHALACEIELCSKFLILDSANAKSGSVSDDIIKNSNCEKQDQKRVVQFLTQSQGIFQSNILGKYFNNIIFRPKQIEIRKISYEISEEHSSTQHFAFVEKVHFHKASLCVEDSDILTSCESCSSTGKKNITLSIRGDKLNYTIPIEAVIKTKVRAYITERSFAPGELLSPSYLREIEILTDAPAQTQINIEKIKFYSTTHLLNKGDIVKTTDIMPMTIVKPGKYSRVILKSGNLSLQSEGHALHGATLGETVQVKLKNKTISAVATDFDEVMVEL